MLGVFGFEDCILIGNLRKDPPNTLGKFELSLALFADVPKLARILVETPSRSAN